MASHIHGVAPHSEWHMYYGSVDVMTVYMLRYTYHGTRFQAHVCWVIWCYQHKVKQMIRCGAITEALYIHVMAPHSEWHMHDGSVSM